MRRELILSDKPGEVLLRFAKRRQNMKKKKREELGDIHVEFWDTLIDHQAWQIRSSQAKENDDRARQIADMDYATFVNIVDNVDLGSANLLDKRLTKREMADALYSERVLHKSILNKKDEAKRKRKKKALRELEEVRKDRSSGRVTRSDKRGGEYFERESGYYQYVADKRRTKDDKPKRTAEKEGKFVSKREHLVAKNKQVSKKTYTKVDPVQKQKKRDNQVLRAKIILDRGGTLNSRQRRRIAREKQRASLQAVEPKDDEVFDADHTLSTIPNDQVEWKWEDNSDGELEGTPFNKSTGRPLRIDAQSESDDFAMSEEAWKALEASGLYAPAKLTDDSKEPITNAEELDVDPEFNNFKDYTISTATDDDSKSANDYVEQHNIDDDECISTIDDEEFPHFSDDDDEDLYDKVFGVIEGIVGTISSAFSTVSKRVPRAFVKMIVQLATFAFDVGVAGVSAATAAVRFVLSYAVEGIKFATSWVKGTAIPALKAFFKAMAGVVNWSACGSVLDKVREFVQIVLNSDLCKSVYKVLRVIFLSPLFGTRAVTQYFNVFGRPSKPITGVFNIVECLVDGLSGILRALAALSAGVPLNQILLADNPAAMFFRESDWICANIDNVYIGLPVEGMFSLNDMRKRVSSCVEAGEQLVKDMKFWDAQGTRTHQMLGKIKKLQLCLEQRAKANGRIPPYAVVVYGNAGIGKSTLRNTFFSVYAHVAEREFDESQVFARDVTSEYFEGYEPLSMPYWHYPEVGNESLKMAMNKSNNIMTELQRICDTTPFPCNMAAVDLKGKYYASPEMVFIDTNNEGMWMDDLMAYPSAGHRRFAYVDIAPKEEFRKHNSTEIDGKAIFERKQRAEENGESFDHTDVYNCTMYRYKTNGRNKEKVILHRGNFAGLLLALKKDMIDHLTKNAASKGLFGNPNDVVLMCLAKAVADEKEEDADLADLNPREIGLFDLSDDEKKDYEVIGNELIEAQSEGKLDELSYEDLDAEERAHYTFLVRTAEGRGERVDPAAFALKARSVTRSVRRRRAKLDDHIAKSDPTYLGWFQRLACALFMWIFHLMCSKVSYSPNSIRAALGIVVLCPILLSVIPFLWFLVIPLWILTLVYFIGAIFSLLPDGRGGLRVNNKEKTQYYANRVKSLLGLEMVRYAAKRCCEYTVVLSSLAAILGIVYKRKHISRTLSQYGSKAREYMRLGVKPWSIVDPISAQNQEVRGNPGVYSGSIVELSEKAGCVKGVIRSKDGKSNVWIDMNRSSFAPAHQSGLESLDAIVRKNVVEVNVCGSYNSSPKRHRVHLFFVKGTYALINGHVFQGMDYNEFTMKVPYGSNTLDDAQGVLDIVCDQRELMKVTTDVYMISLSYREGRNLMSHIAQGPCTVGKCALYGAYSVAMPDGPVEHKEYENVFDRVYSYDIATMNGDCGKPLVMQVGETGACIAGIHVGGFKGKGYSVPITRDLLEKAFSECPTLMGIPAQSGLDLDLLEPKPKSPFVHESFQPVDFVGRVPGPIMLKNKSKMVKTPFSHVMGDVLDILGGVRTEAFGKPVMKPMVNVNGEYISPYNVNLRKMAKPIRTLDRIKLMRIRDKIVSRVCNILKERGVDSISPVHLNTAINGFPDDEYFRKINMNAAAGFGNPGKKIDYFLDVSYDDVKQFILKEENVDSISRIVETYASGKRCHFIYKAQLKDEPRPMAKVATGSTRLFYMSSLENLLISRMFLGPFYTLMVQHGDIFRTSVGINIHDEADALIRDMLEVGSNFIEFDYSGFDVSNVFDIAHCASGVVYGVLAEMGYNEFALSVVRGLLSDTLYPIVEMNRDLFTKPGMQMSGRYATAEDNSLRNLVMMMYAWETLYPNSDFFECTRVNTFGDDVVGSVDDNHLEFNNLFYQDFALKHYGMIVTPAVKNNSMSDFLSVDEISYLKRNFVLRDGVYVAPIDLNTIYKMMEWRIPSSYVTEEEQLTAMTVSCLWEVFFHANKEQYNKVRNMFVSVLVTHLSLPKHHFFDKLPLYEVLYQEKIGNHPSFDGAPDQRVLINGQSDSWEEEDGFLSCEPSISIQTRHTPVCMAQFGLQPYQWTADNEVNDLIDSLERELKELEGEIRSLSNGDENLYRYVFSPGVRDSAHDRTGVIYTLLARRASIMATIQYLNKRVMINAQSDGVEMSTGPPPSDVKESHDTFVDIGGDDTCQRDTGSDYKIVTSQMTKHRMEGILSRPVEIVSVDIPSGTDFRTAYSVWDLFSLNPTVRAKLRNFAYLRGNLHLRVTISGSPFHHGRMMFSYQPMPLRNANLNAHATQYTTFGELAMINYFNYLSQAPGCVIADVKANKPFEMELPYISHKAMFRLFNSSTTVLTDTDSYSDLKDFGRLYVSTLNRIGCVSDNPSVIHMQIVAWMEDVDLGTPTASVMIVAESDERETGPVERISTAMARSMGALGEVPVIGPYAQASSVAFSVAAEIAAFFGWSRPLVPDEPAYVRPKPIGNMANGIGYDTSEKLTLDPKQEIILNPRCCGVDSDDLILSNVYSRWSYLTTFIWAPTDSTLSSVLWRCAVNPALCSHFNSVNKAYYQPTAMAFCSAPFRYWNGTIEVRVEIVCSAFHRGKLAVLYEPNVNHQALVCNSITTNKNHMKVIDLQEVQTMDFCVNWAHKRMWAQTYSPTSSHNLYGTTFSIDEERQNGFIAITPYTKLQSPNNSSVHVNIYVRGKDLSFSYLDATQLPRDRIIAQSEELQCEIVSCIDLNEPTYGLEDSAMWHFGESFGSFRVPLKRFHLLDTRSVANAGSASTRSIVYNGEIAPKPRPAYGTTTSRTVHLIEYMLYAYLGLKGSGRYKMHLASNTELFNRGHRVHAHLASPTDVYGGINLNYSDASLDTPSMGTVGFVPSVSGGFEIEAPFYTTNMFIYAFADDHVGTNPTGDMSTNWVRRFTFSGEISAPPTYLQGNMEYAIGEDFSLIRFSGAPGYAGNIIS